MGAPLTPSDPLMCAVSHVPLYSYRTCIGGHTVHPLLVDCREWLGVKVCPVEECGEALTTQLVTELSRKHFNTVENHQIAFIYCIPRLTDPKTQRIFSKVMRLSCGHPCEDKTFAWIQRHNGSRCITCDELITSAEMRPRPQVYIDRIVTQFSNMLKYTPAQNRRYVSQLQVTEKGLEPPISRSSGPLYALGWEALKMSVLFSIIWACSLVECRETEDDHRMLLTLV